MPLTPGLAFVRRRRNRSISIFLFAQPIAAAIKNCSCSSYLFCNTQSSFRQLGTSSHCPLAISASMSTPKWPRQTTVPPTFWSLESKTSGYICMNHVWFPHCKSVSIVGTQRCNYTMIKDGDTTQPYSRYIERVWRLCSFDGGGLGLVRCLSTTYVLFASTTQEWFLAN